MTQRISASHRRSSTVAVRFCLSLAALILALLTGCKDYRREEVQIDGRQYQRKQYELLSSDSVVARYAVSVSGKHTARDFKVSVLNADSSIIVTARPSDSSLGGDAAFDVSYRTVNTPTGIYPVKVVFSNSDGDFIEVISTLNVTRFYDLLTQSPNLGPVTDTVTYRPFPDGGGLNILSYETVVSREPGAPAGDFIFSRLGYVYIWGSVYMIDRVKVHVDSLTGEMTAPPQSAGGTANYSGTGRLWRRPGYTRANGYFHYRYDLTSSSYEGHLAF